MASPSQARPKMVPERYRTIVDVVAVMEDFVEVFIAGYDPVANIQVKTCNIFGPKKAEAGKSYLGLVNLGEDRADAISVVLLAFAPEPNPIDGLA